MNVVVLDIETAGQCHCFEQLDSRIKEIVKHHKSMTWEKCGLFAELGRVVCITIKINQGECVSFWDENEYGILIRFLRYMEQIPNPVFVGVNIIGFDFPFLLKRFMFHRIEQDVIKIASKPWENEHIIDLRDRWQMGNRSGVGSLELMCTFLNIESPKEGEVKGYQVHEAYYNGKIKEIVEYCERDVEATFECYNIINKFIKN